MSEPGPESTSPRPRRDRHGRGPRGPAYLPGPLSPGGVPAARSRRERFDSAALAVVDDVRDRVLRRGLDHSAGPIARLEVAVEEIPVLPAEWSAATVPLSTYVAQSGSRPPRLVLFRRPLEHRAQTPTDLEALLLGVVVEQVGEILGVAPEEILPDYDIDE